MSAWLDKVLTRQRMLMYPAALLVATLAAYLLVAARSDNLIEPSGKIIGHDFLAFYMAGEMAAEGQVEPLYQPAAQTAWQQAFMAPINPKWQGTCLYLNPPHYAWLMSWISWLGYGGALAVWWVFSLACFAATAAIWRRWLDREDWVLAVILAVSMPAWFQSLAGGQNTFVTLMVLSGFCACLLNRWDLRAGLVLSLLAFKFQFLLIPAAVLLVKGRWRAIGGLALGGGLTLILTVVVLGPESISQYVGFGSSLGELMRTEGFDVYKQHSWHGFFALAGSGWLRASAVRVLTGAAALGCLWLLWRIWKGPRSREPGIPELQLAGLMLVTLMASPHLFHYDMLLSALPAVLWLRAFRERPELSRQMAGVRIVLVAGFAWLAVGGLISGAAHVQASPVLMAVWTYLTAAAVGRAGLPTAAHDSTLTERDPFRGVARS